MQSKDTGCELIKEYLGIEFISRVKQQLKDSGIDNINKGWRMEDKNYEFVKFDLEYVYYKKIK